MEERSKALGTDKITRLLWKFSLPAIVGMMVNALYNVIDSIFVGNGVGEIGLTAVTIAFPVMLVLMGFGMLVGVGAAAMVSIRLGERDYDAAEKILGNALTMVMVLSVVMSVFGLIFLRQILVALGATEEVLPYSISFTRIILAGSIFMYIGFGLNNIIRAEGNPRVAMATMIISALVNAMLNPLFIFGMKLGIQGSAIATVIAQTVSAGWVLSYFLRGRSTVKLRVANLALKPDIMADIIKIGLSPFLIQIASSLVTIIFNFGLLTYSGEMGVAAIGIISRVTMFIVMPIIGINQGLQPILGYNYGAGNYDRVKEALRKGIMAATIICIAGFVLVQAFAEHIIRIFNTNPELVAIGSHGLRVLLCMLPIIGFQIISSNYFQAVGKAGYAIFLSMSRQVIILIPLLLLLPKYFGLWGIWFAGPAADISSAAITGTYLMLEVRKLDKYQTNRT